MAGKTRYMDKVSKGTFATTLTTPQTSTIELGAKPYNTNLNRGFPFYGDILAAAIYSTTLDTTQIGDLTDTMNAL